MGIFPALLLAAWIGFIIEEFFLIKPIFAMSQSDLLTRRIEMAAFVAPGFGMLVTVLTLGFSGGLWLGGVINVLGVLVCLAGLGLRYLARRVLGRYFAIGVIRQPDQTLVQEGPYRFIRHPGYLGLIIFYAGFPIIVGNWLGVLLLSLPAVIIFVALARVEDQRMTAEFGCKYMAYQARTSRFIPYIW